MSFKKKSIKDLSKSELSGKRVLVRVDFNVPISEGNISDDTRVDAALPTIQYLIENEACVILCSHMGRPKGQRLEQFSLGTVAILLSKKLNKKVPFIQDCVGEAVSMAVSNMNPADVVLLENLRFYQEEEDNDALFSKQLASFFDLFVQDAFGVVHRSHASTAGVCKYLPSYAGFLIQKELDFLGHAISDPKRPLVAIIGGSKISSKIGVLRHLLGRVDTLIIGGAMTYTLLKSQGVQIGTSLVEDDFEEESRKFLLASKTSATSVLLPIDHVCATKFSADATIGLFDTGEIPSDYMGLDIGPKSIEAIRKALQDAGTIIWNGPLGVFELEPFSKGTFSVADILSNSSAITIIGGGDSAAAISMTGLSDTMSHISTGGGASLELLEGKGLPGIDVLEDSKVFLIND